jgi:hypothetical protein
MITEINPNFHKKAEGDNITVQVVSMKFFDPDYVA